MNNSSESIGIVVSLHLHVPAWENRTLASRPRTYASVSSQKKKDVRVCHVEKRMRSGAHRPTNVRVPRTEKRTRSGRGVGAHADVVELIVSLNSNKKYN